MDLDRFIDGGKLFDGHYKLLRPLSTDGATADVWLAVDVNTMDTEWTDEEEERKEETGMLVAIKIYRPKNSLDIEGEQRFRDEFKIVYECRHANLLQPTGFSIFQDCPYLVLPYCRYGSSEQLIGKSLSEDEIWKYVLDVSSGLNRLHTNTPQIVHQDIKPANILIDNTHNYAITDFGISSTGSGHHGYYYDEENSGTLAYMAPERFQKDVDPMPQSDIWAFGATLCEILTGCVPFGEEGGQAQIRGASMPVLSMISAPMQRVIHACLDKEPGNRPSAQQLMDAARARQFPLKRKLTVGWIILLIAVVTACGVLWKVHPWEKEDTSEAVPVLTPEEEFKSAMTLLESNDADIFLAGYRKMDSLSKQDYLPAIYEMAFTHGWYSDPESIRRKEMLDIRTDSLNVGLPVSDSDNQQAIAWLIKIHEKADTLYPAINARASYRLAGYYYHGTPSFPADREKVVRLYKEAESWAERSGDKQLIQEMTGVQNEK